MKYRYQVDRTGIVYLSITLLVGLAAAIRPNNILVWVFGLMLGLIAIGGLVSGGALYRMKLRRLDPHHGRVGRPLVVRYAVSGGSRRIPLFDLTVSERTGPSSEDWSKFASTGEAWLMHASPGETVHADAVLVPERRGRMRLDRFVARSSFPFGLLVKSVECSQPMETLVYPRTVRLEGGPIERLLGRGADGDRSGRQLGSHGEFAGVREYQAGDSIRNVAWRRSMRHETPIVVQRSLPAPRRLLLVLDLRRPTSMLRLAEGSDPREAEEKAITLTASIAETALDRGVEVGLRIPGTDLIELPIRAGRRHLDRLLANLAAIDLEAPRDHRPRAVPSSSAASLVIVHPDRVDTALGHEEAIHLLPASLDEWQVPESASVGPVDRVPGAVA